jgi:diguanylate cyclase (GGDEF)-like protein
MPRRNPACAAAVGFIEHGACAAGDDIPDVCKAVIARHRAHATVAFLGAAKRLAVAWMGAGALLALASPAVAGPEIAARVQGIEIYASGHPKRAVAELAALLPKAGADGAADRLLVRALLGQSLVMAGRTTEALGLANELEAESPAGSPSPSLGTALLVRSSAQSATGDTAKANALAKRAYEMLQSGADPFLTHWALMAIGTTARGRGLRDEALSSLHEALALAEQVGSPYRRSSALYQLSILYFEMKQGQSARQTSLEAYRYAQAAGSAYAMASARMAESAAMELLDMPERELAAMEEALVIARKAQSVTAECRALINLSDIQLRRRNFQAALDLARSSQSLAKEIDDPGLVATSDANMGFALFGLGRTQEAKRLTDQAVVYYELTGATAEIASLLEEYAQYLEKAGDYKAALALYHRERKLNDEISLATHQRTVLELQEKYESEKRQREIALLNRENAVTSTELHTRVLQQRVWWLVATVFGLSFLVVTVLYRKLRATNRLLGQKNRELRFQSSRDPLTALYNRRYFQDFIDDEASRPERRRSDATTVEALLLIDLDNFKATNDGYGHSAGDAVLVAAAQRLREALRETDMIVRWGGEEFLVYVAATQPDKLDEIALRIMHALATEPFMHHGCPISITASVGYVPMPLPPDVAGLPWERAIGLADMALYMAKVHGRNRAYGIRRLADAESETLAAVERDLERAWRDGLVDMQVLNGPDVRSPTNAVAAPQSTVVDSR